MLSLNHGVYIIEKGYKKTVCPDGKYFHQNKLFFIFTLIIFSEHSYFLRKSQITPERKQRKKIFFNSICTPPEHPNSPQSLYLWAFSQFSPLLKLGKSKDILKYICLSFMSFLPLFYFCCIYYFGSLIFCCQFVAIKLLCNITSTFQQIISLRELNFYGSHIPSLANVD